MKNRKVSISIGGLQRIYGDERALEIASEIGADAVDFALEDESRFNYKDSSSIYSKNDDEIFGYFSGLKKKAENLGVEIGQTHGRITGFKNIPEQDSDFMKDARIDCLATKALGAPVSVVHSVTTMFLGPDAAPELMHSLNLKMFNGILKYAKQYNIKIASETFGDAVFFKCCDFFGNINEFIKSYDLICKEGNNSDYFTVCVDTGHSNKAMRFGNPNPAEVIRRIGSNVTVLHLNDNDTFTDQHKIPKTGTIDWDCVFYALDEVGYEGNYNMEIALSNFGKGFEIESARFAVKLMKYLLHNRYGE